MYTNQKSMILFWRPRPETTFGEIQPAGLYFHMALLAKLSFQYGPVGKPPGPRNQSLPTAERQRYGSKLGKTIVQGTLADAMKISPTLGEPRDGDLVGVEA
jgi:hypothetical protein